MLNPRCIDRVVDELVRLALDEEAPPEPRPADLKKELAQVDAELTHYACAIAQAGPLDSLLAEITAREAWKRPI